MDGMRRYKITTVGPQTCAPHNLRTRNCNCGCAVTKFGLLPDTTKTTQLVPCHAVMGGSAHVMGGGGGDAGAHMSGVQS